jgi:hypothetical protein
MAYNTKKQTNDYWKKLKDPRWQKKRLEIFNRDNWTCQSCGSGADPESEDNACLHVHHKSYEWGNDPWEYPDYNFITLCEDCHGCESDIRAAEKELLESLRRVGFLTYDFLYLAGRINKVKKLLPDFSMKSFGRYKELNKEQFSTLFEIGSKMQITDPLFVLLIFSTLIKIENQNERSKDFELPF